MRVVLRAILLVCLLSLLFGIAAFSIRRVGEYSPVSGKLRWSFQLNPFFHFESGLVLWSEQQETPMYYVIQDFTLLQDVCESDPNWVRWYSHASLLAWIEELWGRERTFVSWPFESQRNMIRGDNTVLVWLRTVGMKEPELAVRMARSLIRPHEKSYGLQKAYIKLHRYSWPFLAGRPTQKQLNEARQAYGLAPRE